MRRLTLILSDLYLPAEASTTSLPIETVQLPNLEQMLRVADAPLGMVDWRHWLSHDIGVQALGNASIATVASYGLLAADVAATAWLATPVRLEARLDHVRLTDRGLLRLGIAERLTLIEEFSGTFGPQFSIHDAGERGFLLSGLMSANVPTTDPARLLDADIVAGLPGARARELRRLGAEIDMWLHASAFNAARERAGMPRVSSFWLWGGGGEPLTSFPPPSRVDIACFGVDPWLAGFARAVSQFNELTAAPKEYSNDMKADHAIVELTPMSGIEGEGLAALEERWFAPVRTALARGEIDRFRFVANDRCFELHARSSWRFWRRRHGWLAMLRSRARQPKA
jgi:hypothetical protein